MLNDEENMNDAIVRSTTKTAENFVNRTPMHCTDIITFITKYQNVSVMPSNISNVVG